MSSFGGRMKEYERISLDRFDGKNLQSTVYFLSHLHEDHTVGLATPVFFKHLKTSKNVFLYCSEVTEVLIKASKKYRHLVPYIKKIAINTPTTIEIPDPLFDEVETVTVTFLPAFHCPGSVMCLFEGHEGTVLYTGDFRWEHFNIEQMYHLRSGENVKKVKSLYIDTTFCTPENLYIPSRQHCIDATYQLVCEWISQSPQHVVYMSLRAQYGHEPLLNAVASRLNKKIHVDNHKVEVYDQIHEFHGNFTDDGAATQIHACGKQMHNIDGEYIPCRHQHDPDKILVILPTTMYFTQFQHLTLDKIVRKVGDTFFRVCYSFHSSYTEVKDLISYLKPENVYPNVKPPSDASMAVVQHRLNTMLAECMQSIGDGDTEEMEVKQLGMLKTRTSKRVTGKRKQSTPSDTESLDFGTPSKVQKPETEPKRQTRGRGRKSAPESSQESKVDLTPSRGRGRGRQTRSSQKGVVEPPKRASTRSRSKKGADVETSQQKTPVKKQRSESPDVFLTPSKSEISEKQSSYAGSHGDESEIDLTLSQKSLDLESSMEKGDNIDTWTGGSFLTAVSSHDEVDACIYLYEDVEQTDENFEDVSQIEEDEGDEEGRGLSLEDVEKMETDEIPSKTCIKKTPARKGRKSKGKTPKRSNQKVEPVEESEQKVDIKTVDTTVEEKTADISKSRKTERITQEKTESENVKAEQTLKEKGMAKGSVKELPTNNSAREENLVKSVEKNIENTDSDRSKEEIITEIKETVESGKKSRGRASKQSKKKASLTESEMSVTDKALDKSPGIMTEAVGILKKDSVMEESKSDERHEKKAENIDSAVDTSVSKTIENRLENDNVKSASKDTKTIPQTDLPDRVSESALGSEDTEVTGSSLDKLKPSTDEVCKIDDKSLTDSNEQISANTKEKKQQERKETQNKDTVDGDLNLRVVNVDEVKESDTSESVYDETVQNNSVKELEPKSDLQENKDNGKNDNSMDNGATVLKENSCDSDVLKVSALQVTESETRACVAENESTSLKQSEDTMVKDVVPSKGNLEISDSGKLSPKDKDTKDRTNVQKTSEKEAQERTNVKNTSEKEGQEQADSDKQNDSVKEEDISWTVLSVVDNDNEDDADDDEDEDISKAIMESMGSEADIFNDEDSQVVTNQETGQSELSKENVVERIDRTNVKVEDATVEVERGVSETKGKQGESVSNKSHVGRRGIKVQENGKVNSISAESDSDDIIEDTPPDGRPVVGSQLNNSLIFSVNEVKSDQNMSNKVETENYYTRHWPLPPGLSKQEKRRKRKLKQKKKKQAAMRGAIYYDDDVEIVIKNEPKIEIDLTRRKEYDENDFEYDMDRQRKKARKDSGKLPDDQKITVFKTEKVDDHLYGGSATKDVFKKEKRVQRLKYTRRNSFNGNEENEEDAEFIAALETASTKKSNDKSTNEPSKAKNEKEKSVDKLSGVEAEDDKTKKSSVGKGENEESKTVNSAKEKELENSDKTTEENDKEIDKQSGSNEKAKQSKSKIQFTETKEGKKLMRISLSGSKKSGLMPKQNDLKNEIFIDLSEDHDDEESFEKAGTSTKETSSAKTDSKPDVSVDGRERTVSESDKNNKDNASTRGKRRNRYGVELNEEDHVINRAFDTSEEKVRKSDILEVKQESSGSSVTSRADTGDLNKDNDKHIERDNGSCIIHVGDDENSDGSSSSGEWLSCSKAAKDKQPSQKGSKKGRQKKTARKIPETHKSSKKLNVEKEPVENVIDKYVKHISSAKNGKDTNLDTHDLKKRERVKQKALEAMFDMDFETESQDKTGLDDSVPGLGSFDDLYEETISLSSDSEIEAERSADSKTTKTKKETSTSTSKSAESVETIKRLDSKQNDKQIENREAIISYKQQSSIFETLGRISSAEKSNISSKNDIGNRNKDADKSKESRKNDFGNRNKDADKNKHTSNVRMDAKAKVDEEGNRMKDADKYKHTSRVSVENKVEKKADSQVDNLEEVPMDIDGDEDVEDDDTSQAHTTENIPAIQSSKKRKRNRRSRQPGYVPTISTASGSLLPQMSAVNTTIPNIPFIPGFPTQSLTVRPPQSFSVPPPAVFNTPPPGFNAAPTTFASTSKLGAAPKVSIPPPLLVPVQAPGIPPVPVGRYPTPLGANPFSKANSATTSSQSSSTLPFTRFPPPSLPKSSSIANPSVASPQSSSTLPFTRFPPPALPKSSPAASPAVSASTFTASVPFVSSPAPSNYPGSITNARTVQSKFNASKQDSSNPFSKARQHNTQSSPMQPVSKPSSTSFPDSTKSRFSFQETPTSKPEIDPTSFLASLPGTASQSLLSSLTSSSSIVGTLNKVLDVIMNTKAYTKAASAANTTTQSVVGSSEIDRSQSSSQDQHGFGSRDSDRNRFDNSEPYRRENDGYGKEYERRQDADNSRYDDRRTRSDNVDVDRHRRLDSERAEAGNDPRYDADRRHQREIDIERRRRLDDNRPPMDDEPRYDPERMHYRDDADFDRFRRLDSDRSLIDDNPDVRHQPDVDIDRQRRDIDIDRLRRLDADRHPIAADPRQDADVRHQRDDIDIDRLRRVDLERPLSPYRDRPPPPYDDRPLSPFSEYERERAWMHERERARREFYERRRQEYGDDYDDYYRRRREIDPYYDYPPPPRYRERPHDPFYDDPYYDCRGLPPREYDDRPRSPLDCYPPRSELDEAYERRLRDPYYPDPRDNPYYRGPRDRYDVGREETSAIPSRESTREIAQRQTDKQKDKIPSLLDAQVGAGQAGAKNTHQQNLSVTKQVTAMTAKGQQIKKHQMEARPRKPSAPIVVARGKRVQTGAQDMIEKAQASMHTPVSTPGTQTTHTEDSDKPAFCTGLNPSGMDRTGYVYRRQSRQNYGGNY